uniref:Uncharacterized protein n=1 Tax=Rhodosorus marinus TaxID=101924 RepID=A0A7S2Z9D8_9RHOD|mmetsp:Transcript_10132/g.42535  ORF Transcript_10132/g.42535 Transcript_10132/m.42535 type:complete len:154 (+) Transcript_10132:319-780(+)
MAQERPGYAGDKSILSFSGVPLRTDGKMNAERVCGLSSDHRGWQRSSQPFFGFGERASRFQFRAAAENRLVLRLSPRHWDGGLNLEASAPTGSGSLRDDGGTRISIAQIETTLEQSQAASVVASCANGDSRANSSLSVELQAWPSVLWKCPQL